MRFIAILICVMAIAGCAKGNTTNVADIQQAKATAEFMAKAQRQVGMPNIVNFQERKLAKQIFELRDQEKLICYAYLVSLDGKLVFMSKCIGFGLPYSVQ